MARIKSKKYTGVYTQVLQNGDKSYYITYKENKKDIWKKIGLHSEGIRESYCHQKRNEIVTKLRLGEELPHVAKKNSLSLNEIAEKFYNEKELHNKENRKTRSRIENHVKEYFGNSPLNLISKEDITKLQKELSAKLEPATINFIVGQVSAIFTWAIDNEFVDKNPCINVRNLKVDNTRLRYLELEEIKLLKEKLKDDKTLYYFVLLGLSTGGRLQTICNIKPADLKDNGTIKLYDFKNESEYYGFIENNLLSEIMQFIDELGKLDNEYVFQATYKPSYTNQYYYRKLQPIFDELFNDESTERNQKVTIHTLRHTFASHLAINETPILTIKKLMNHNDINTTMKYAKLSKSSGEIHVNRLIKSLMNI